MINIVRKALFDIAPFFVWLPLFVALFSIKKWNTYLRLLVFHLLFAAIIQAIAYYLWKNGKNNMFLLHIYTAEELTLITLMYMQLLKGKISRNIFLAIIAIFIICAVLNTLYLQPITGHNTYVRSLESLIIIIWAIAYFYSNLANEESTHVKQENGILVINSAFLLYFSASLLLFTLSNFISVTSSKNLRINLWAIHALVSIIMYLLIAIGLWKHRKTAT